MLAYYPSYVRFQQMMLSRNKEKETRDQKVEIENQQSRSSWTENYGCLFDSMESKHLAQKWKKPGLGFEDLCQICIEA